MLIFTWITSLMSQRVHGKQALKRSTVSHSSHMKQPACRTQWRNQKQLGLPPAALWIKNQRPYLFLWWRTWSLLKRGPGYPILLFLILSSHSLTSHHIAQLKVFPFSGESLVTKSRGICDQGWCWVKRGLTSPLGGWFMVLFLVHAATNLITLSFRTSVVKVRLYSLPVECQPGTPAPH